ncbi:hypothetical protein A3715_01980 [Oleiphilus sp. HI0009]|nr:hypothetical protein A3715_01980 [Oleiphilus sp. HI0009]KZY70605.1 hypothetical protein A3739_06340 [Oleiphilus sp. HI0067]KZZ57124.1 hypothetical protein A3762_10425 [Oleiphilus sp. HI0125]
MNSFASVMVRVSQSNTKLAFIHISKPNNTRPKTSQSLIFPYQFTSACGAFGSILLSLISVQKY